MTTTGNGRELTPGELGAYGDGRLEAARYYRKAITSLYDVLGFRRDRCKKCQRAIWWVRTKAGKAAPYTADGISHFADCPGAADFRGPR